MSTDSFGYEPYRRMRDYEPLRDYGAREEELPPYEAATGYGKVLPDVPREPFMPMSRRDVDTLHSSSLNNTREFLEKQREQSSKRSVGDHLLQTTSSAAGAALAGYLAQRFRGQMGPIPIGILLGTLGHGAAYLQLTGEYTDYVHSLSDGAISGAIAIWAAGHGALGAEKAGAVTGEALRDDPNPPLAAPPPYPFAPPPAFPFSPPHLPSPGAPKPSEADFQAIASQYRRAT